MEPSHVGSQEPDYSDFYFAGNYAPSDKTILSLKKRSITNPRKFTIMASSNLTKKEVKAMTEVLRNFGTRKLTWDTLDLNLERCNLDASLRKHFVALLVTANKLGLFNRLTLTCGEEHGDIIVAGLKLNKRVKALTLDFGGGALSNSRVAELSLLLRTTKALAELNLWAVSHFCQPQFLAVNRTLKRISLRLIDISDASLSDAIKSLSANSALADLQLHLTGTGQFGRRSSDSLNYLLSSSPSLRSLSLVREDVDWDGRCDTDTLLEGIKASKSLKLLHTSNTLAGDNVFTRIFSALVYCSSLEKCCIHESQIGAEDIERVALMDRLPKPVEFNFRGGIFRQPRTDKAIENVLRSHPEIRLKCYNEHQSHRPTLTHLSRLNMHGRYLLDQEPSPPLSIWPKVLEKVNSKYRWREQETIRTSLLYELLKGPAFASD